jgi:hypothetical protein
MSKTCLLAVLCALAVAVATPAVAKTSRTRVAMPADLRSPLRDRCASTFVCSQDLFDRNNRNNLRSDWPGPPAQPAQF